MQIDEFDGLRFQMFSGMKVGQNQSFAGTFIGQGEAKRLFAHYLEIQNQKIFVLLFTFSLSS